MKKEKIAISIDPGILRLVDARVDNSTIRSRSQAIENLLEQALKESPIESAVILIHERHQNLLLQIINEQPVILLHLKFLAKFGINKIFVITKKTKLIDEIDKLLKKHKQTVYWVFEKHSQGTASALTLIKNKIHNHFVVINGDSYNEFDLAKMITVHLEKRKLVTMGLNSTKQPTYYGTVNMEGDSITHYSEGKDSGSFIINAGIYIMRPEIFKVIKNHKSLEKEVFPKLAAQEQLQGFILPKKLIHIPEKD